MQNWRTTTHLDPTISNETVGSSPADSYHTSSTPISDSIEKAAILLPTQAILQNFVHHNPLEHLQHMSFKSANDLVHDLESNLSPSERVLALTGIDPRKRVNESIADLSSSFLDRGAAKWAPRHREQGFLFFFASLENLGIALWRKHARLSAAEILLKFETEPQTNDLALQFLNRNITELDANDDHTSAIRSMLLEQRGWAGMFRRMEKFPSEAPINAVCTHLTRGDFARQN